MVSEQILHTQQDAPQASIQYLHHSGFLVDTGSRKLLFDWDGSEPVPELGETPACIFVSHGHEDHYSKKYTLFGKNPLKQCFSFPTIYLPKRALCR